MDNKITNKQIAEINRKLDFLVEQIEEQRRRQKELEELKHDLTLIGKDIFQAAVVELNDVAPYFDTDDLIHLFKKLLRNTRTLTRMLDALENLNDFLQDARPLGKHAFEEVLQNLNTLDRKGYFAFMKEIASIFDTIVTSFTVEDVRLLRENITTILLTIKNLTQPDMLSSMNNAVGFYKKMDIEIEGDISYRTILKELKDPEVRRGLVFMLEFVKRMANQNGSGIVSSN